MYDGSTATAEAMMMCVASAKKRNRVLVSETLQPAVLRVVETYAHYHGVDLVQVPATTNGTTDLDAVRSLLDADDVAGVVVAQPNRYGIVEDYTGLAEHCHAHKALLAMNAMASSLGVLRSPGEWGADIACGDAQSLGLPLNFGGPYIGYLCTTKALIRKMPGRLVGQTEDADGKRAFVLTLQAREQHIRREKATSNICTAQGFMCLCVAAYLALMGKQGLEDVNALSYAGAHHLHDALLETGLFEEAFPGQPYLCEFALRYKGHGTLADFRCHMAAQGFLAGVVDDADNNVLLVAVTEQRSKEQMDRFMAAATQWAAQ